MNEVTLPPSPNGYLSNILACASNGTVAWGARGSIVIAKANNDLKKLDFSIIKRASENYVTSVAFSPTNDEDGRHSLVSSGDDNIVKLWSLQDLSMKLSNSALDKNHKVIRVDWSMHNPNLVCFVSESGLLVKWKIHANKSQIISLKKVTATCMSCCPHDCNIVAIGCKSGLVYIVDIRGTGNITYELRGHGAEIVSLSWCPVPIKIFESKDEEEFFLASGAKDRFIFLWKAGTDGRCQTQFTFPSTALATSNHESKVSSSEGDYTAVCWLEPTILLTSSPCGELLMWDLNGSAKKKLTPKLIHKKHGRGLFSIAGLAGKSIEQIKDTENEDWRSKTNIKAIWTLAQDQQVICCSLLDSKASIEYSIPSLGGSVYCMSACPVDTSQIAFGVGDGTICLWNLSEPHQSTMETETLWKKIKGKVRAISWHPEKENLLAFATNEGRVGIFNIHSKKPPLICQQYHRRIVYSIGWGPAPNVKDYALYTCGDGELVYYNPETFNDRPLPAIKKKECTEFCWKPDYSILALGFKDGSIAFLNRDLKEYGLTILTLKKAVERLTWHPESTSSDMDISTMRNYLAVATNSCEITIFDIFMYNPEESKPDYFYKTVATLKNHSKKVVCLSWSPHISGFLVSGSYDNTAQVWKIETQEVIATYASHLGSVKCCMWSPLSQDLIITGSTDYSLHIWSICNHKVLSESSLTEISTTGRRTQEKKTKKAAISDNQPEIIVKESKEVISHKPNSKERKKGANKKKLVKKKKPTKINHFPGCSQIMNDELWCVRDLLDTLQDNNLDSESGIFNCQSVESIPNEEDKTIKSNEREVPLLLGSKQNLEDALNCQKKILISNNLHNVVTEIDLWTGNLKENLQEAMQKKRLNDFLVSLAASVSIETWETMCEAYATQLIFQENPHKAVSYYLCINKVYEAVNTLVAAKLYKEAYALAASKLDVNAIKNVLMDWANYAVKEGHFQNATECYIKLGDYAKAARTLERRKDIHSLILAIEVAEAAEDLALSTSLAGQAVLEALSRSDFLTAKSVVMNHPQIQFLEVEVEVFIELSKTLESIHDELILNWLQGLSNTALLEKLSNRFTKCPKNYLLLLQKNIHPLPVSEKLVQMNVSHQLALAIVSDQRKQRLQHIVKACDIISQYEKTNRTTDESESLLLKYLFVLDNKNLTDLASIFNGKENGVSESLRAYLCHAIVNWFHGTNFNEDQLLECTKLIIAILKKWIGDLLNKESVKFWTTTSEINKVETQLSVLIGQSQSNDGDNVENTEILIERLHQLRNDKKQFLDKRISSPNPSLSYGVVMEFLSKIPDEQTCQEITELVMNTWVKATS